MPVCWLRLAGLRQIMFKDEHHYPNPGKPPIADGVWSFEHGSDDVMPMGCDE